jgi:hypothetical protein
MNTAAQIRPPLTPGASEQPTDPGPGARATAPERRHLGEMLAEIVPLVECVPVEGPPVALLLGPWLFLAVMLAGPFVCLFAIAIVMIVAAIALATVTAAVLAPPYLLVGHLRRHRARRPGLSARTPQRSVIESPRLAA